MNKIFSVVRNSLGKLVVANEFAKSKTIQINKTVVASVLVGLLSGGVQSIAQASNEVTSVSTNTLSRTNSVSGDPILPRIDEGEEFSEPSRYAKFIIRQPEGAYGVFGDNQSDYITIQEPFLLNNNATKMMAIINPTEETKTLIASSNTINDIMVDGLINKKTYKNNQDVVLIGNSGSNGFVDGLTNIQSSNAKNSTPETVLDISSSITKNAFGKNTSGDGVEEIYTIFFDDNGNKLNALEFNQSTTPYITGAKNFTYNKANVDATNLSDSDVNAWRERLNIQESGPVTNNYSININNVGDEAGLEMGTGSRARGQGSIATGKNSIAIGKNAVATGGNETKETIVRKLNENQQRLNEITTAENRTNTLLGELQNIRKVEADVIEAGERVKQVRQAKQTAYNVWQQKLKTYNDTVSASTQFFQDAQAKIDDLNSRLTGVSRIGNINISSEEGLTSAATKLKAIAEEGTSLNLGIDFYKDYVSSYYKALGDLRISNITKSTLSSDEFSAYGNAGIEPQNVINPYYYLNYLDDIGYGSSSKYGNNGISFGLSSSQSTSRTFNRLSFRDASYITPPTADLVLRNIATSIVTLDIFEKSKTSGEEFKTAFNTYFTNTNDPLMTVELRDAILNKINKKIDVYVKSNEVAYYQGQYESTKNTEWLDKKAIAIQQYNQLIGEFNKLPLPYMVKGENIRKWIKENITDVEEKNRITTATLTTELEKALGINKNAIAEKEAEIARLKVAADQAKSTYDNTNPSASDIALSQRYEEIMQQLTSKSNELKSAQDRLQALRDALTLHDLTNVGENAIAFGTNALSTGTNSLAIGTDTIVTGENSIAMGKGSVVTGTNSIAIGIGHNVLGDNSGAFGDPDYVYGDGSYAFGNNNTIGEANNAHNSGNNTFVIGSNVVTKANNAVILGANSADGGDNTVSVGSANNLRKIVFVGDGTISETSTDAINGKQLHGVLENATGVNKNNWRSALGIEESGNRETVQLTNGTNTSVSSSTNDGVTTYTVNVSDDVIKTAAGTTNLTELLNAKANTNADNLKPADVIAWQKKLGNGLLQSGNTGLVTGGVVADALALKADKNGSNLATSDIITWQGKLGNGTIAEGNNGLVTGGTVATALQQKADKTEVEAIKTSLTNTNTNIDEKLNKDVDNISTTGIANIKNYAKEAVKVAAGDNVSVTTTEDASTNSKTYTVAVSNAAIKAVVQSDLDAKAAKDASNLTPTDITAWQSKLGNGELTSGNKGLVTGGVVADALALKADKTALDALANSVASANTSLTTKADKDLSNLSDTGVTKVKTLAQEAVSVKAGNNVNVSEEVNEQTGNKTYTVAVDNSAIKNAVKEDLDAKANKNADNLTDSDVTGWQQKLGNGKVEAGNKGLLTGDTVNEAIVVVNKRIDEVAARPGGVSGQVLEYFGGGATATEAPTYTITDIATGQDVGYHNVGSALQQLNNNQNLLTNNVIGLQRGHEELKRTVSQNRKEAQAGVAAAVAIASLPTSNEPGKTVFSMAGGSFKGQSAMAMGLSKRTENGKFLLKANASMNTRGDTAIGAGVGFVW